MSRSTARPLETVTPRPDTIVRQRAAVKAAGATVTVTAKILGEAQLAIGEAQVEQADAYVFAGLWDNLAKAKRSAESARYRLMAEQHRLSQLGVRGPGSAPNDGILREPVLLRALALCSSPHGGMVEVGETFTCEPQEAVARVSSGTATWVGDMPASAPQHLGRPTAGG